MKRRNEVIVGIFVTVVLILGIAGTLWLVRRGFGGGYPLYVRFDWGAGLRTGQPVLLAGVQVGTIDKIEFKREGFVLVHMKIEEEYQVPEGTVAAIQTVSFFGDRAIALTPKAPTTASVPPGDTIPTAKAVPSLDDLLTRADTVSRSISDVAKTFEIQMVGQGGIEELRKTVASTNRLVTQLNTIAAEQSRGLTLTLASLRRTLSAIDSARVDSTVRNLQETTSNLSSLMENFSQASARLDSVAAGLQGGQGTAGKFLKDTALYGDIRMLVNRIDSLTADFKQNPRRYINLKIF